MCYSDSGPTGTHGSMTTTDWKRILDEGVQMGVRNVQFIGGEPTLHPDLPELINYALARGLSVEVYTNLVHVTDALWTVFAQPGVSLASSYFSDDSEQHAAITGAPSYPRTKANIAEARRRGIPVRVGVLDLGNGQRAAEAQAELIALGVPQVGYDQLRELGRGARGPEAQAGQLCGRCGDGAASIGPDGTVRPCTMSRWQTVGNVHDAPLEQIVAGLPDARDALTAQGMPRISATDRSECRPISTGENCFPYHCHPR
jgi:MoaA/NifB/PqqE/SkfB family radical SAM enzyme